MLFPTLPPDISSYLMQPRRTAIRQHPDAPFKYQPEHCHPSIHPVRSYPCRKSALQTWINAVFSSAMTRSIPPQANAFLIMVQRRRPQIEIATSIGRIASIDAANGFLYTGNQTTSTARSATSSQIPPSPIHPAARSHFHPSAPASASALHMQPHRPQASHLRQ